MEYFLEISIFQITYKNKAWNYQFLSLVLKCVFFKKNNDILQTLICYYTLYSIICKYMYAETYNSYEYMFMYAKYEPI